MKFTRYFATLFILLAGLALAACEDEEVETAPLSAPAVQSIRAPVTIEVSTTEAVSVDVAGEPSETLDFVFLSGGGSFSPNPGFVTLSPSGTATISVSYTAPAADGGYSHILSVTDSRSVSVDAPFDTVVVPPLGTLITTLTAPAVDNLGLTWDGQFLRVSNNSTPIKIYRIDSVTGIVIQSIPSTGTDPRDLAWDGTTMWLAGGVELVGGQLILRQLDPVTGAVLSSFPVTGAEMSGVTWDGTSLWLSRWNSNKILQVDTLGTLISSIPAPGTSGRGITWVAGTLWQTQANCTPTTLYNIDPATGTVLNSFVPSAGSGCPGLAFDGRYLWLSEFGGANLYQFSLGTIIAP